jgi:TetR/AcrR family transcriptional regulator, transcriptional repressor for nem operon
MPAYKTSRAEIIKEAFQVFLKKGYYHTSISDLSKACKIEKAHFYYYFKDKKDLMISVLGFGKEWAIKNMFVHAYNQKLNPAERMNKLLEVFRSIYVKGFTGCIFSNTALETANNDEEFAPIIKEYFGIWHETLTNIYMGKFNKLESEQKATRFFNELNGALMMMKLHKDIAHLDAFIDNHTKEL